MRRARPAARCIACSLDRDVESHIRLAQLVIERAKRLAEAGQDVFVLLDSLTRLARAYNKGSATRAGRCRGGVDIKALDIPKRLFGTARAFDEGGSLTVLGTALIETGSRMDDVIFQEFKGTGNMELVLDRKLADRRIWPAIDIAPVGHAPRGRAALDPDDARRGHPAPPQPRLAEAGRGDGAAHQDAREFPTNKEFLAKIQSIL